MMKKHIYKNRTDQSELENILQQINYRSNLGALAQWRGESPPYEPYLIYEGFEHIISLDTINNISFLEGGRIQRRLKYSLIGHYLQKKLLPHELEMRTWINGAAAKVNGQKLYFRDIISWCQKSSTRETRKTLQKETGPLCKFLKPFVVNYWNTIIDILKKDLGYKNYLDYCSQKKAIDYGYYFEIIKKMLDETDDIYFPAMDRWCMERYGAPLKDLTRFDAINILGMGEFDEFFPKKSLTDLLGFFKHWKIEPEKIPGLNLELGEERERSSQAMCFMLQIPEEVYVHIRPEGGWIDLETLWHELGHGFSAVFTSPDLPVIDRDMAASYSLSESFAFLLQNLSMSKPFLAQQLGMTEENSKRLYYHKVLRDLSVFRRYAAKFLAEFDMFSNGDLSDGNRYAELLAGYTGFYYQPECRLFDLAPEFYCFDYLLGWMSEAIMEKHLLERFGSSWMFKSETGNVLKDWWSQGSRHNVFEFFHHNNLGPLTPDPLLEKWHQTLGAV